MSVIFGFMGEATHNLDDKGRLALPGRMRDELAKSARPDLIIAHGDKEGYISLYPCEQWQKINEKINDIQDIAKRKAMVRLYLGQAYDLAVDKAGRILLPPELRDRAGLEREVKVLGGGFKMELWARERLETQLTADEALVEDLSSLDIPL